MPLILILKLLLVPVLIALVTLAGRRWGPAVAGWLSAFPVVSGPILLFIAIEQGAPFAASAAVGTLSAVLAVVAFGIGYAWAATRHAWPLSLLAGLGAYLVMVALLGQLAPSLWVALVAVAAALVLAPRLYPLPRDRIAMPAKPANDIALRMAAGAVLVLLVTHFANRLGPALSGVLAMFPVMGSVLTVFSHRHSGADFAIRLLRGMVLGFFAFAAFCVVLALLLPRASIAGAFLPALVAAVAIQAASRLQMRQPARRANPAAGAAAPAGSGARN
jgi:hypothetical protein